MREKHYLRGTARNLRKRQTDTEQRLWYHLRDRRMKGMKFRRQHPIDGYIIDFYCPTANLAIELDGGGHAEKDQKIYDREREKVLASHGIEVLRFWDNEIWNNLEGVLQKIWNKFPDNPSPCPSPLKKGRGNDCQKGACEMKAKEQPLSVVIAAVVHKGKILLIRRRRGDYVDLWGLPGGKVEKDEHLSQAALREIAEETGIEAEFKGYLGLVSEHLEEDGKATRHFLLHLCELTPKTTAITRNEEGELGWFSRDGIGSMKDRIIPSDFLIIQKMVDGREGTYYNCVLRKSANGYAVKEFSGVEAAGGRNL